MEPETREEQGRRVRATVGFWLAFAVGVTLIASFITIYGKPTVIISRMDLETHGVIKER